MTQTPTPEPQGWDILTAEQRQRVVLAREARSLVHVSVGGSSAVDAGALLDVTDWLMNGDDTVPEPTVANPSTVTERIAQLAAHPKLAEHAIHVAAGDGYTVITLAEGVEPYPADWHVHSDAHSDANPTCDRGASEGGISFSYPPRPASDCTDVCDRCSTPLVNGETDRCRACEVGDDEALPADPSEVGE